MCYINLQFSKIFLLCKEAAVGPLLRARKPTKSNSYLFIKICCMKLGDHKMKIKTYLATEETIKRVLSNCLKLVLFKTA